LQLIDSVVFMRFLNGDVSRQFVEMLNMRIEQYASVVPQFRILQKYHPFLSILIYNNN
jgi:hypothetical protein